MNSIKGLLRQRRVQVLVALGAMLVAAGIVFYGSGANKIEQSTNAPLEAKLNLKAVTRGENAIRAMGANITTVARAYAMSPAELRKLLRADRDLALDRSGKLFYTCSKKPSKAALKRAQSSAGRATAALAPLAGTFTLHSRPASQRIIYLDFDGVTLTGTAWNAYDPDGTGPRTPSPTIVAPAWDTDGDPASFSDAERTAIQQMWQRVAEDYAPFDVDVTTEEPPSDRITRSSSADTMYGTVALISPISSYIGNYGGLSYIGIYNRSDATNYYKPALIFPENLGNNEKYIGEAISHETGHNLGLSHDGTTSGTVYYAGQGSSETGWAPIMGVGYYRNLTQWSKGEYLNANQLQDDLAVIQTYGLSLRGDEAGDDIQAATALPISTTLGVEGVITTATDVDVFSFASGSGLASISVTPAERGPNLDIQADILDASGAVIATANPIGYLAGTLSPVLPAAGTYFLRVQGVGEGDPLTTGYSDYASLGQYTISGTVPAPQAKLLPAAAIAASPGSGEAPVAVAFDASGSSDPDGSITSYAWDFGDGTDGNGVTISHAYQAAGTYTAVLTVTDNDGLTATADWSIAVSAPNQAPTAVAIASPASGTAPLATQLSAAGSADLDGSITSYAWDFGDGTGGSGATISHTYQAAGAYDARVTVTDDRGATGTATTVVTVAAATPTMKVQSIAMSLVVVNAKSRQARAVVKITNASGAAVSGATVNAQWSGVVSGTSRGVTGSAGTITLRSKSFSAKGTATLTVTGVVKSGVAYTPDANVVTKASITY